MKSFTLILLSFSLVSFCSAQQSCAATLSDYGSSWDLTALRRSAVVGPYSVKDVRDQLVQYVFNVCDQTSAPTTFPANACTSGNRGANANPALAWQIEQSNVDGSQTCYRLGGNLSTGWTYAVYGEYELRLSY